MFDKLDGFIRDYDGTKYLVLFSTEKYDVTFDWDKYLIGLKSRIKYVFFIIMQKSKLIQMMTFPLKKTLILHNGVTLLSQFLTVKTATTVITIKHF